MAQKRKIWSILKQNIEMYIFHHCHLKQQHHVKALTSSSIYLSCKQPHRIQSNPLDALQWYSLISFYESNSERLFWWNSILQCLNTGTDLNVTAVEAQVRARAEQRTIQQELITAGYCPTVKAAGETGAHPGHKHHRLRNYRTRINPCWFLPSPPWASHGVQSTK